MCISMQSFQINEKILFSKNSICIANYLQISNIYLLNNRFICLSVCIYDIFLCLKKNVHMLNRLTTARDFIYRFVPFYLFIHLFCLLMPLFSFSRTFSSSRLFIYFFVLFYSYQYIVQFALYKIPNVKQTHFIYKLLYYYLRAKISPSFNKIE